MIRLQSSRKPGYRYRLTHCGDIYFSKDDNTLYFVSDDGDDVAIHFRAGKIELSPGLPELFEQHVTEHLNRYYVPLNYFYITSLEISKYINGGK